MAAAVVMPALEMAQETGVLIRWLKQAGESVTKGEPLMEVETDKAAVEIESPGEGVLGGIIANEGDVVPVGNTIAWILSPGEEPPKVEPAAQSGRARSGSPLGDSPASGERARSGGRDLLGGDGQSPRIGRTGGPDTPAGGQTALSWAVTPLARNIAEENGVDLTKVTPTGNRIEKADVLAYMGESSPGGAFAASGTGFVSIEGGSTAKLRPASPKARRLAVERGMGLASIAGSGPEGAVLAADVISAAETLSNRPGIRPGRAAGAAGIEEPSSLWRVMAARMSESWRTVPHFYLVREVEASRLLEWRDRAGGEVEDRTGTRLTLTDLLVKCAGWALRRHPRVNAAWADGAIRTGGEVNVGIAAALDEGLVVPVIRGADWASLAEIAGQRSELLSRARERKLRPEDMDNGSFTITNLGMYKVDAFNAIVNPPQAAILAVGRIAERVVPIEGRAEIRPMMVMTLSCDHRVVDGVRAAQFLDDLAQTIEDPWRMLI